MRLHHPSSGQDAGNGDAAARKDHLSVIGATKPAEVVVNNLINLSKDELRVKAEKISKRLSDGKKE